MKLELELERDRERERKRQRGREAEREREVGSQTGREMVRKRKDENFQRLRKQSERFPGFLPMDNLSFNSLDACQSS